MKTVFYCLTLLFFFFAAGTANAQEPTCTLTAVPNSVASGESSVLTWTIQNASNASIAPNIGSVSHLINGSQEVTPTETTNYTMTVGGRVLTQPGTCTARVTVTNSTTPVEEPFTPSRFIPCEGKGCSACNLVEMGNELIVWLFGMIFLLFAVLMTVAGFGLVTSGGNPSAMQAAKDKFTNAMIGLVIVMSAWLIVDTVMKALVGGGETDAAIGTMKGWGPWSEVQCQTQTPVTSPPPRTGGGGVTATTAAGDLQARVAAEARRAFGSMSTASHSPGGGTLACAWAVNQILSRAGVSSINGDSVVSMQSVLNGGRGTRINQSDAKPGDLVLVTGARTTSGSSNANHVGICMNNGCTQVYSNSSGLRSFSWSSGPTFTPSYINARPVFYRINN